MKKEQETGCLSSRETTHLGGRVSTNEGVEFRLRVNALKARLSVSLSLSSLSKALDKGDLDCDSIVDACD
ncbi:hypothetical protein Bca4012_076916 [Brassica carinata]